MNCVEKRWIRNNLEDICIRKGNGEDKSIKAVNSSIVGISPTGVKIVTSPSSQIHSWWKEKLPLILYDWWSSRCNSLSELDQIKQISWFFPNWDTSAAATEFWNIAVAIKHWAESTELPGSAIPLLSDPGQATSPLFAGVFWHSECHSGLWDLPVKICHNRPERRVQGWIRIKKKTPTHHVNLGHWDATKAQPHPCTLTD